MEAILQPLTIASEVAALISELAAEAICGAAGAAETQRDRPERQIEVLDAKLVRVAEAAIEGRIDAQAHATLATPYTAPRAKGSAPSSMPSPSPTRPPSIPCAGPQPSRVSCPGYGAWRPPRADCRWRVQSCPMDSRSKGPP